MNDPPFTKGGLGGFKERRKMDAAQRQKGGFAC